MMDRAMLRKTMLFVAFLLAIVGASALRSSRADAAQCYVASGKTANVLCWLDMSSIDTATNVPTAMSWTLPDGSVLRGTVTSLGPTVPTPTGLPTYSGSPLGNTAYTGVGGKPAFYGGGTVQVQITNLSLVDSQSNTISSFTIAGADAETLDTGDGATAYVSWTTAGTPWSQLEIMPNTSGSSTTICTLAGLGTQNAKCVPAYPANDAAYILSSVVSTGQSVAMGVSSGSLQGMAFAVNLASVSLAKKRDEPRQCERRVYGGHRAERCVDRIGNDHRKDRRNRAGHDGHRRRSTVAYVRVLRSRRRSDESRAVREHVRVHECDCGIDDGVA